MKKISNIYKRIDDRGTFMECLNGLTGWKSINGGFMKKGALMGNHYHKKNQTLLFILSGAVDIFVKDLNKPSSKIDHLSIKAEEGVIFAPYETHAWRFLEDSVFLLIKSEKYSLTEPDTYESKVV